MSSRVPHARSGGSSWETQSGRVLVVDDAAEDRFLLIHQLNRELPAAQVEEVNGEERLARAIEEPDILGCITDYQLRWTDGLEVLRRFKARHPEAPIIMFTGSGGEVVAVEGMKAGLDDYILKTPNGYGAAARALRRASCSISASLA